MSKSILYCSECGFPPEYCLYGARLSKCKAALLKSHRDMYERLYGSSSSTDNVEAITDGVASTKLNELDKEAAKKEAKAQLKEDKAAQKRSVRRSLLLYFSHSNDKGIQGDYQEN